MDPQQPTANTAPSAEIPVPPEPQREAAKGLPWITTLSVAAFIILSLAVVAFLYYQNQQLKSMLASYQTSPSSTPEATQSPTPNPELPTISSPSAGVKVTSPLKVTGTAPAGWMFEGVFPIKLVDSNQKLISQGEAKETVAGSWQSGNPVDFSATLTFKSASGSGTLILQNDNPSGITSNSKSFEIPVNF